MRNGCCGEFACIDRRRADFNGLFFPLTDVAGGGPILAWFCLSKNCADLGAIDPAFGQEAGEQIPR